MTKRLRIRRRIELHHDIDVGEIESSRGDVRAEEDGGILRRGRVRDEFRERRRAFLGCEVAVEGVECELGEGGEAGEYLGGL